MRCLGPQVVFGVGKAHFKKKSKQKEVIAQMTDGWSHHPAWNVSFGTVKHLLHLTSLIFGQVGSVSNRRHLSQETCSVHRSPSDHKLEQPTLQMLIFFGENFVTFSQFHYISCWITSLRTPLGLIPCNQVTVLREISLVMTPPTVSMPKVKGVTSNLRSWAKHLLDLW